MIQEIKNWLINVSKELCSETVETAGTICSETVETAGTICDETRKQNAQFVKAIMDSLR